MTPTLEILSTGDELLTGQVVDTNSTWLMDRLWDLGLMVRRKTLVADDRADLQAALREVTGRSDVVVMSGGMGPTEDDLTSECVAAVMGVPLELHSPSLEAVRRRFQQFGRPMTPNNEKQAMFPQGAAVIPNRFGTAPGFSVQVGRARLFCLPGVPAEYKGLCEEAVLPELAAGLDAVPAGRVVKLFGLGESAADQAMRPVMDDPRHAGVRFGYRAHWPEVHVKWMVADADAAGHADRILRQVRAIFGDAVWGEGKDELPRLVVEKLLARGERVSTAESCTGGLVAELLTSVAGSSGAFDLGLVAYSYEAKTDLVGVPAALLATHGAVSEPVARALAEGARARGKATWGIGITGIAGPGGGTPEKPVGTVHLALAGPDGTLHVQRLYRGGRDRIRHTTAFEALFLLHRAMR